LISFWVFLFASNPVSSQTSDTIANWDGINVVWTVVSATSQTVQNPDQQGINPSANCMEINTSDSPYDLIYTDFTEAINFDLFPVYRLKILAPESGGSVLLKFENSDNTAWHEIEKTPIPGQWDDLEFDFTGVNAADYFRMVVFFDFTGTTPGKKWYIDDVLRVGDGSPGLSSNLPLVIINTGGVNIPDEPKITAQMGIIDNGPDNMNNQYDPYNDYDGFIGIEIRGQSSQMFPKKSYSLETRDENGDNLNVPLLGMPEENDWILYAPYSDKSMLRNFMTFYIGGKLDTYCSRMAFCEVIINNDYQGVYILMEKIKKDENRVNIAKLKVEDISGDELTGGYIVKVDKIDPDFVLGIDGWLSVPSPPYPDAKNITFQYYYPEANDIVTQQSNYIRSYISSTENTLTSPSFADPDIGYNRYINTGSFIDLMIVNEISKDVDNYRYSTFFYKEKESDGGRLFAGPAWDFNLGYSNVDYWPPGNEFSGWHYTLVEPHSWSIMFWWKRLMEDSYFRDLFITRWDHMRQHELSDDNLEYVIDSVVNYIDDAQQRNYEKWPILGEYVWPNYDWANNDYDDEVAFFENWLFDRINWIDNNVEGKLLYPSAELSGFFPELRIDLSDDYFSRTILKKKYFNLNNSPLGLEIDTVIRMNASEAVISLSGELTNPVSLSVTIEAKVLNSFNDLTSSELIVSIDDKHINQPRVVLFSTRNAIHLQCNQPALLGNRIEIYNISGQIVNTSSIEQTVMNHIDVDLPPGIYLCRYQIDGRIQTGRLIYSH